MTSAAPIRSTAATVTAPSPRRIIDLQSALKSTVRTWLVFRDQAIATVMSGTDETDRLELIKPEPFLSATAQMNQLRGTALHLAGQIAELNGRKGTGQSVLLELIRELLTEEEPRFLLSVPDEPDAF